jgi:AcrR family transcriptional regulator
VDEIARLARAGKPTIYCRFVSKEALFTAVMMRAVLASIERFESNAPTGASVEERLESVGATILRWVLVSETIGMIRLIIAEARAGFRIWQPGQPVGLRTRGGSRRSAFARSGPIRRASQTASIRSEAP